MNLEQTRENIVDYLKKELIGPKFGDEERLPEAPFKRYTMGILFPQETIGTTITAEDEEEDQTDLSGGCGANEQLQNQSDEPVELANQFLPSSMGISFFLKNDSRLKVEVYAARYSKVKDHEAANKQKTCFVRKSLEYKFDVDISDGGGADRLIQYNREIFDRHARINIVWRILKEGWLVTVSLINNRTKKSAQPEPEDCLHQVKIICRPVADGFISPYPSSKLLHTDLEDQILELIYHRKRSFGVGHGCSINWVLSNKNDQASEIQSELLPRSELHAIKFELDNDYTEVRSLLFLAGGEGYPDKLVDELHKFESGYREWITNQRKLNLERQVNLTPAKEEILQRMENAAERIAQGIRLIETNVIIRRAFCLANRAMLLQYIHSLECYAGKRHAIGRSYTEPDLSEHGERTWRPFQLAYLLLTLSSVAFPENPDRNLVDLIWFPTGGGKTEAYLAVTAFLVIYRRMTQGDLGYGTAVIMRYTLRLLTTQQFQRAATLFCSLEMIRRRYSQELGDEEFSIGLWVGGDTTPNDYQKAVSQFDELLKHDNPKNPFQLDRCPWCGTEIIPEKKSGVQSDYGVHSTTEVFFLFCPEKSCPFHSRLPVGVVDEQLYNSPPTLLLATVDKFARMAWVGQVRSFFGSGCRRPPELIIQDELHLISGPLGTLVGIYETAIDALCSWKGVPPKILASTATIRRADDQCKGLFARQVQLFPPTGLLEGDSYFARSDNSVPGRLYIGVMGQGHTSSTSMIRVTAALLQAPIDLGLSGDDLDAYWSLIAYHNSMRELGKSLAFIRDDIPARIRVICLDQAKQRELKDENCDELTSNIHANRLSRMLDNLSHRYNEEGCPAFLACTNMFSVGVDVQRLGLMLMNGQPKSTSEYIQATSRVGRGVPGLIVTLLSPTKPRDRSHYERFIAYHQSIYREVEPTSVTPFAPPARERALHAILVALVRHGLGLNGNEQAGRFNDGIPGLDKIVDFIKARILIVDERELTPSIDELTDLIRSWSGTAEEYSSLAYESKHKSKKALLRPAGSNFMEGWDTLNSLRNVDKSCVINVIRG